MVGRVGSSMGLSAIVGYFEEMSLALKDYCQGYDWSFNIPSGQKILVYLENDSFLSAAKILSDRYNAI